MSKEFICKGCGEKFNKDMQSNNIGYCYICNEFYMQKQIADLEAKLAEKEQQVEKWKQFYNIAIEDFNEIQEENDKTVHLLTEIKRDYDNLFNQYIETKAKLSTLEMDFDQLKKFDELNKTFFELFKIALDKPEQLDKLYGCLKSIQEDDPTLVTFTREQIVKLKQLTLPTRR